MTITAKCFITPAGRKWLVPLVGIAGADVLTPNAVVFTAEASGASGNQFNVGASDAETAVNAASAMNLSTDVNTAFKVRSTGPWTLDLSSLANSDIISLNGNALTAKTSGASGASEFNLGSDHGASELAALINASVLAKLGGVLQATAASTTVTLTGDLLSFVPPSTASHAVCTAADAILAFSGSLTSYASTVASGSAPLIALSDPALPFTVAVTVSSDAGSASVIGSTSTATPHGSASSATPVQLGTTALSPDLSLPVPASGSATFAFGAVAYAWQLDGTVENYDLGCTVRMGDNSLVQATSAWLRVQTPNKSAPASEAGL